MLPVNVNETLSRLVQTQQPNVEGAVGDVQGGVGDSASLPIDYRR